MSSMTNYPAKRGRRPKGDTLRQEAEIVWALAVGGDINENHAGGNATKALNDRMREYGVTVDPKNVYNRISQLERKEWIERLMDRHTNKCHAIRLKVDPAVAGENPFEHVMGNQLAVPSTADVDLVAGPGVVADTVTIAELYAMPLTTRIQFASQLLNDINKDYTAARALL